MIRRFMTTSFLVGALILGSAFAQDLRVGLLLPFTGEYDWVGANVQPVAQMVADEVNASGGIDGREISFAQGDTEGTVDAGFTAAQKLINVDDVLALVGPTSLSFTGSRDLILDNGVPVVSPTAGTTELDRADQRYLYRTVPSDALGGRALARAATSADALGRDEPFQRPFLMVGQAPALISFEEPILRGFEDYGTPVVGNMQYQTGKPSYRSEAQQALREDPDLIVLVGSPEDSARVMEAAFQAGYQGSWFVTQDQTTPEFVELVTAGLAEGIYGLEEVASPESAERNEVFRERYREYSGGDEVQIFGTNTFDAMNVLALAMLRAHLRDGEISRETIADHIPEVANPSAESVPVTGYEEGKAALEAGIEVEYRGLAGPIDFDEWGNITAPFGIRQVQDGRWTNVSIISADALQ